MRLEPTSRAVAMEGTCSMLQFCAHPNAAAQVTCKFFRCPAASMQFQKAKCTHGIQVTNNRLWRTKRSNCSRALADSKQITQCMICKDVLWQSRKVSKATQLLTCSLGEVYTLDPSCALHSVVCAVNVPLHCYGYRSIPCLESLLCTSSHV